MKSCAFIFLFLTFLAWGQIEVPTLTGPVMDNGALLSFEEQKSLAALVRDIHKNNGPQIQILTIESLKGEAIEDYSIRVAEKWMLGTKEQGNGLIILISKNDRKIRIEVGQGIEGEITDYEALSIIDNLMTPEFKKGRYAQGISYAMMAIAQKFSIPLSAQENSKRLTLKNNKANKSNFILPLILLCMILYPLYRKIFGKGGFSRALYGAMSGAGISLFIFGSAISLAVVLIFAFVGFFISFIGLNTILYHAAGSGRFRSGGFSSGGGGWSGGGGGFSGGGASGGW